MEEVHLYLYGRSALLSIWKKCTCIYIKEVHFCLYERSVCIKHVCLLVAALALVMRCTIQYGNTYMCLSQCSAYTHRHNGHIP
jgi:hypothetical protein